LPLEFLPIKAEFGRLECWGHMGQLSLRVTTLLQLTLMAINLMLLTLTKIFLGCLGVWLWLFFKVLFTQKNMPIIFFYFLKIIFEINISKWFENIKNILLQKKKNSNFFGSDFKKHSQTGTKLVMKETLK